MSVSTEALLVVARLDERGWLSLADGESLIDVARVVDENIDCMGASFDPCSAHGPKKETSDG